MNEEIRNLDDPRLTAYALGELPAEEAQALAALLARSPEAAALVEETRLLGAALTAGYRHELASAAERADVIVLPRTQPPGVAVAWWLALAAVLAATGIIVAAVEFRTRAGEGAVVGLNRPLLRGDPPAPSPAAAPRNAPPVPSASPLLALADDATRLPPEASTAAALPVQPAAGTAAVADAPELAPAAPVQAKKAVPAGSPPLDALAAARPSARLAVAGDLERAAVLPSDGRKDKAAAGFDGVNVSTDAIAPAGGLVGQVKALGSANDMMGGASSFGLGDASYAAARRGIAGGRLPAPGQVRIQEWLNAFSFDDPPRAAGANPPPLAVAVEAAACPWAPAHRLVRIGIRARGEPSVGPQPVARRVLVRFSVLPAGAMVARRVGSAQARLAAGEDSVPLGDLAAGQGVTLLYELRTATRDRAQAAATLTDAAAPAHAQVEARIAQEAGASAASAAAEKSAEANPRMQVDLGSGDDFAAASPDFKFAAAVAGFGLVLGDSPEKGSATLDSVADWARAGLGPDPAGVRHEFLDLVHRARALPQR